MPEPLLRGLLALTLGALLLIQPGTLRPLAFNVMGVYWLLGGVVSLSVTKDAPRFMGVRTLAGVIGIVAGVALITRTLTASLVSQST